MCRFINTHFRTILCGCIAWACICAVTAITCTFAPCNSTNETSPSEAVEPITLYDVPLDDDLQIFIINEARSHGIDPAIIISMIYHESTYNADAVGDNGKSLELMQINPRWHSERMSLLSCTDLLNPYQNVTVGIDYLAELFAAYGGNIEMALTAYNMGPTGAEKHFFSKGDYSSQYSRYVMDTAKKFKVKAGK